VGSDGIGEVGSAGPGEENSGCEAAFACRVASGWMGWGEVSLMTSEEADSRCSWLVDAEGSRLVAEALSETPGEPGAGNVSVDASAAELSGPPSGPAMAGGSEDGIPFA
jgi:hypothetical protein